MKYGIFYILGNENPPRDTPGQRMAILERILQEIADGSMLSADHWFVLNRIVDIPYRRALLEKLTAYNAKVITLPFDQDYVLAAGEDHAEFIRRCININETRNTAVKFGLDVGYETVVVFDGDCCFNEDGWSLFRLTAEANPDLPYLSIPHHTVKAFTDTKPETKPGEPMLAFRANAKTLFDTRAVFGDGDKLKLLYHVGHDRTPDSGHCALIPDVMTRTAIAGYCLHLQTGSDECAQSRQTREEARVTSMLELRNRVKSRNLFRTNITAADHIPGFFDYSGQYSSVALDAPDDSHCVEVGCWLGKSVVYLAHAFAGYGKRVRIDCVDTWDGGTDNVLLKLIDEMGGRQNLYEQFCRNISGLPQIVDVHHMKSVTAAKRYANGSLDFVFIDAGHSYEDVFADIKAWYPKVRAGGLIAGHDFVPGHPAGDLVVKAVLDFFDDANLEIMPAGRVWKHVKADYGSGSRRIWC